MNFLLSALPGPSILYRIGAYLLLAASLFGFGWFKGSEHWHTELINQQAKAMQEGVRIQTARKEVTTVVEAHYYPVITKGETITKTIVKEVPAYVSKDAPPLGAGWRELHDAAADMRLPRPAGELDAADTVPQDVAARTVAENYRVCNTALIHEREWQEWVREQQKVKR